MTYRLLIWLIVVVNTPVYAQVDKLFRPWDTDKSPGAAVAVLYRGEVIHHEGYGMANLEHAIPISSTSVFDIASVSKQFCAFAIAMLVDEGKITLDEDLRTYLPELPDFGHTITIENLLYHTSGLRDWPGMLGLSGRELEDVISMEEILFFVKHQQTLNFVPGTRYSYSNTGYTLLALVIERISGQSFRDFMKDRIFEPLGMTRTFFQDDHEEVVPGRVTSYSQQSGEFQRIGNGLMATGSSSLHTTTEDLLNWVQNFEDQSLGTPAVHSMMNLQGQLSDSTTLPYGFGLVRGTYRGLNTLSHSGGWAGFRTIILRIPDHEFAVIVLGNHASLNATAMAQLVAEHYLGGFMAPPEIPPTPLSLGDKSGDYEGIYDLSEAHVLRLTTSGSSLFAHLPPTPSVPAQSIGADSLYIPALSLTITFARDSLGQITHASTTDLEAERLPLPKEIDLTPFEGCYNSAELGVSYWMRTEDGKLIATGPRGKEFELTNALENVFTSDSWSMPVIRFFVDTSTQTVSYFEANSSRNRKVVFNKGC
ncbi:MAG: serine hydrolase [Bacteroidota bacterium]|nr:serine hydrolase [Bacteroidota bacterium]MDE2646473.1 serine hydrolase [Bacteroidota bacterium]